MEEILFILNRNDKKIKYHTNNNEIDILNKMYKVKNKLKTIELLELNIETIKDYYEMIINNYKCDIIENIQPLSKEELVEFLNNEYLLELIEELKEKVLIIKEVPLRKIERELEYKYNKLLFYIQNIDEDNLNYLLNKKRVFEEYYYNLEKYYYLLKEQLLVKKRNTIKI